MTNAFQRCTGRVAFIVFFAALLCSPFPSWAGTVLGSAQSFAVLGYAGVTNTGNTQIYGNVGVIPLSETAITGFPPGEVTGGQILGPTSLVVDQALYDINAAVSALNALSFTSNKTDLNLGERTLTPGVYFMSNDTALLNGTLTLDALGDPNAHFVFQLKSKLTTGSGSVVNVINGTAGTEVYWVVGSSAELGPGSTFEGNILAYSSIALLATAKIECGRAFARTESVTLIDNNISGNCAAENFGSGGNDFGSGGFSGGGLQPIPEPGTPTLFSMGLGAGFLLLRKFRSIR